MKVKQIIISLFLLMVFLSGMVGIYSYYQRNDGSFNFTYSKKAVKKRNGLGKMTVKLNMGADGRLWMTLSVPYERSDQAGELLNKYPKITNDFNMYVPPDELEDLIKRRDFDTLRTKTLKIINNNLNEPIKTVYFDAFFYN